VEGAKAADAAALAGFRVVAIVGASTIPSQERLLQLLQGETLVRVWPDNDEPGVKAMRQISERLVLAGVAVDVLTPPKTWEARTDIADIAFPGMSAVDLHARMQRSEVDEAARERVKRATTPSETFWTRRGGPPRPSPMSKEPGLLDKLVHAVHERGVHGEDQAIRIIYLAATSRLLARPVNVVVKGPSAGGKSFTTEAVLEFLPDESHLDFTAMSERALIYVNEPLSHRMIVIYEASGLESDIQTYIIRSLLSEGRIKYLVTVPADDGGWEARTIEKEGPTGLITTTTATNLHAENETRMLSITVSDDAAQTAAIMLQTAAGRDVPAPPKEWLQHQEWLAWHVAERRRLAPNQAIVHVPFAEALARLIPPVAVRLRRDFRSLLTLIEAHALLHTQTRQRDDAGRIVAELDDYSAVVASVDEVMAEASARTVSKAVRETVEYVSGQTAAGGQTLTMSAIAKGLNIDQSSATRRVQAALEAGYLADERTHERQPAKIRVGGAGLPVASTLLPTVQELERALE